MSSGKKITSLINNVRRKLYSLHYHFHGWNDTCRITTLLEWNKCFYAYRIIIIASAKNSVFFTAYRCKTFKGSIIAPSVALFCKRKKRTRVSLTFTAYQWFNYNLSRLSITIGWSRPIWQIVENPRCIIQRKERGKITYRRRTDTWLKWSFRQVRAVL